MWQAINNKVHVQLKIWSLINFLLSADTTLVHSFFLMPECFPITMSKKKKTSRKPTELLLRSTLKVTKCQAPWTQNIKKWGGGGLRLLHSTVSECERKKNCVFLVLWAPQKWELFSSIRFNSADSSTAGITTTRQLTAKQSEWIHIATCPKKNM